jgi:hypothetical protein
MSDSVSVHNNWDEIVLVEFVESPDSNQSESLVRRVTLEGEDFFFDQDQKDKLKLIQKKEAGDG